ncbi:MAG: MerR family transcriptional regulator [Chitinophagaceae bacterium]|nr:MerR family transcriptional regulator [Chitinophagaceae bacterium]
MNSFSISQLAQFSGIKPHTIRIWEQRYNALTPQRSEGNTRYYDNTQLRRLLNIVSLMESDYKISELCAMPDKKLFGLLEDMRENMSIDDPADFFITQLIVAGVHYDEQHFEKIFSHCIIRYGFKNAYIKLLYPLLLRIGLMWAEDSLPPAQEHFISNIIKQKLFIAVDSLPPPLSSSETWLLFLPENEFHEIGLLFAHYLIRHSGRKSIYLGGNVPLDTLSDTIKDTKPDSLLLFFVRHNLPKKSQNYLDTINTIAPKNRIYLVGSQKLIGQLKTGRIHWLQTVDELERELLPVLFK